MVSENEKRASEAPVPARYAGAALQKHGLLCLGFLDTSYEVFHAPHNLTFMQYQSLLKKFSLFHAQRRTGSAPK